MTTYYPKTPEEIAAVDRINKAFDKNGFDILGSVSIGVENGTFHLQTLEKCRCTQSNNYDIFHMQGDIPSSMPMLTVLECAEKQINSMLKKHHEEDVARNKVELV